MTNSRFKKNITIRYQNFQLDDECLTFRNMIKILKILNIDKYQLKNLTNQVEQWIEKHMFTLKHIRFNEKSAIINEHMYVNSELIINAELTDNASSISASHQEHMRFIDFNESEEINKVTTQRNEINTLSIDHETTIDNSINHVY